MASNSRITLLVALVLFLIFATSLAANIANLDRQNLQSTSTEKGVTTRIYSQPFIVAVQNEGVSGGPSGQYFLIAFFAILGSIVAYTYYKQRKRKLDYQPSTIAEILAFLTILGVLVLIYEAIILGIGSFFDSSGSVNRYFFVYILLACSAVVLFLLFRRYDIFSPFRKFHAMPIEQKPVGQMTQREKVEELKGIIDKATTSLFEGSDYVSAIIRCYKEVISLLEGNGMTQRPSLTAREFESEISSRLGVSALKQLHDLTQLFERARYSNEPISSIEASGAKEILRQMSSELSREHSILGVSS